MPWKDFNFTISFTREESCVRIWRKSSQKLNCILYKCLSTLCLIYCCENHVWWIKLHEKINVPKAVERNHHTIKTGYLWAKLDTMRHAWRCFLFHVRNSHLSRTITARKLSSARRLFQLLFFERKISLNWAEIKVFQYIQSTSGFLMCIHSFYLVEYSTLAMTSAPNYP